MKAMKTKREIDSELKRLQASVATAKSMVENEEDEFGIRKIVAKYQLKIKLLEWVLDG